MPHALVVSGGGSKGAFAVGVIRYLREQNVTFDIITGTSTGALIAPLVATDEIAVLEQIYTTITTDKILLKGSIGTRLNKSSIFDDSPLETLINETITQARYDNIVNSGKRVILSSVCLQSGKVVYFSTVDESTDSKDYEVIKITNADEFRRAMRASANQPVFMPPVKFMSAGNIERQYVDGGVREYAPIQIAIEHGATEIYAVILSPDFPKGKPEHPKYSQLIDILGRTFSLLLEDIGANDVKIPMLYSEAVKYVNQVKQKVIQRTGLTKGEVDQIFNSVSSPFSNKSELNIRVFRPEKQFEFEGLEFDPGKMKAVLDEGYALADRQFQNPLMIV